MPLFRRLISDWSFVIVAAGECICVVSIDLQIAVDIAVLENNGIVIF